MKKIQENYYQVLRLNRKASSTEIVAAYHAAKGAFSSQSLAHTGDSVSAEEIQNYLSRIDEAYQTLSDPQKRLEYDEILQIAREANDSPNPLPDPFTGQVLKQYRENARLSLEEVFRITRIPVRFLRAIEEELVTELPARVYLQGFVKNLAHVYKLPAQEASRLFLEHFDKNLSRSARS